MRISLNLMSVEILALDLSIPRLGVFAPNSLPMSAEAYETWAAMIEDDE